MRLAHWSCAFREVEFDPRSGRARSVPLAQARPDRVPVLGFAAFERSLLGRAIPLAVYRRGASVWFHAGARAWRLGEPGLSLHHTRLLPFLSCFEVRENDTRTFALRYHHAGRLLFALIDPTYDRLEEETDYFLDFVAENAGKVSWREQVVSIWLDADAEEIG